jgi:hypothetical protein
MSKKNGAMGEEKNIRGVAVSSPEQIQAEENRILHSIFSVETPEAVEATISFTRYLKRFGLDSENFPMFFKIVDITNHWVTDALIGEADPFSFFDSIPSNRFLVEKGFRMLSKWRAGGVYPKTLGIILGILKKAFGDPRDGYRIYPLSIADVDNLGKHLDPDGGQGDLYNQYILGILEKVNNLEGIDRSSPMEAVARQAGKIRTTFFDVRKTLDQAIPEILTIRGNYCESEVRPNKLYVN